jgi:hypothetical protein
VDESVEARSTSAVTGDMKSHSLVVVGPDGGGLRVKGLAVANQGGGGCAPCWAFPSHACLLERSRA